jgi:hypothetical protein
MHSATAALIDRAPKLPPRTRIVNLFSSKKKYFIASALVNLPSSGRTGFPVNFIFSGFLKYFMESSNVMWTSSAYFSNQRVVIPG